MKRFTNKKVGRLRVLSAIGTAKNGCLLYQCRCECGNLKVVSAEYLSGSKVSSCGCLKAEVMRNRLSWRRKSGFGAIQEAHRIERAFYEAN